MTQAAKANPDQDYQSAGFGRTLPFWCKPALLKQYASAFFGTPLAATRAPG